MIGLSNLRVVLLATLLVIFSMQLQSAGAATITSHLDRLSFNTALGGPATIETFNGFSTEIPFHSSPIDVGEFTISMGGTPNAIATGSNRNKIDVPPVEFSAFDVNGTTQLNVFTHAGASLLLTFDTPTFGFGADFGQVDIFAGTVMDILIDGQLSGAPVLQNFSGFLGFTSDTAFSMIEFRGLGNDGWGIDDVTYSSTASSEVPAPAAWALFGLGCAFIGYTRRKRAARRKPRAVEQNGGPSGSPFFSAQCPLTVGGLSRSWQHFIFNAEDGVLR